MDSNLPKGIIRLPAERDFYRDPAFQAAIEIASAESLNRDQIAAVARQLLTRRAFYDTIAQGWAHTLYTYLVTYHVWAGLEGKLAKSALQRDIKALTKVSLLLNRLIVLSADVLGIHGDELDDLRSKRLINPADVMRELPKAARNGPDLPGAQQQRLQLLRQLNDEMKSLGIDLDLGGEPPAEAPR